MWPFDRKDKKNKGILHAFGPMGTTDMGPEGSDPLMDIESFMKKTLKNSVAGSSNKYRTFRMQIKETYRKFNGESDYGNSTVREVVTARVAAIMGEGVNIKAGQPKVADFLTDWFKDAGFIEGLRLINGVIGSELAGYALLVLINDEENKKITVKRIPFSPDMTVVKDPAGDPDDPTIGLKIYNKSGKLIDFIPQGLDYVYIQTGGDDTANAPNTRVGAILTECENYDRANKDLRINNFHFARITPMFETKTAIETDELLTALAKNGWQVGDGYAGTAKLSYVAPGTGASDNLRLEMEADIKVISGVTGVPLHWLGHADLLSNRSTADSLYEALKYATARERLAWQDGLYRLAKKVLDHSIEKQYTNISYELGFSISLPLLDFTSIDTRIRALSMAYHDRVISTGDYQNAIPGINPAESDKEIKAGKAYDPTLYMNTLDPPKTGAAGGSNANTNSGQ